MAWASAKRGYWELVGVLQALVVEDEALDDELAELPRSPNAEASGNGAFDAVADRGDGVEVVEINEPLDRAPTLLAN